MNSKHFSGTCKVPLTGGALLFSIWWYPRKCKAVAKREPRSVPSFWIHILCQDLESITSWPQPSPALQDWLCVFFLTNQILADTHKKAEALKNPRESWLFLTIISPTLPWRCTGSCMLGNVIWPRRTELPHGFIPHPMATINQSIQGHNDCPIKTAS